MNPPVPPRDDIDRRLEVLKLDISVPEYIESIPTTIFKELVNSHNLLKDYILSRNSDKIHTFKEDILQQINTNIELLLELQKLLSTLSPTQHSLHNQITQLNHDIQNKWMKLELEMYSHLNRYSTDTITQQMHKLMLELDERSLQLYEEYCGDTLTDSQLTKFVDEYCDLRELCHLRSEKYYRLKENRVLG